MSVVLVAHHTPDLYGSDRQLLESVSALHEAGHRVVVALPHRGPLCPLLEERGADVRLIEFPALRKSSLTPTGLLRLVRAAASALRPALRLVREERAEVVYVNTLIIPVWLVVARIARVPALCHVHEAYATGPRLIRFLLASPLVLARAVVVNSEASRTALAEAWGLLGRRARVVYNGVEGPPGTPVPPDPDGTHLPARPARLALVGRLSPNKGVDVALEALAELVARGHDVRLDVAGTAFEGYEWYVEELERRAAAFDLAGRVRLLGYVHPTWDLLADARVVLVPSRVEPFGNTAVEAQLAARPVIASDVQGLREVIGPGAGLLVPVADPARLADAVERVLADPVLAAELARRGRERALTEFTVARYAAAVCAQVAALAGTATSDPTAP